MIFHKSFPLGHSINALTPRHDAASYFSKGIFKYFTLSWLLSVITRAGEGCFLIQFDARDAYKQLLVRCADLFQQVFKAGGKYYVDFCACFGSLYGNDSFSTFAYAFCFCLGIAANCTDLYNYVDNFIQVTAATGNTSKQRACRNMLNILIHFRESGILCHQLEGPTTHIIFLGWEIDTVKMTVAMTEARRIFMIKHLTEWEQKEMFTVSELSSLIGLLIFLSQVVMGIKTTIGVLLERKTSMIGSTITKAPVTKRMRTSVSHTLYVLQKWKGVGQIFDKCWAMGGADVTIYCDIAKEVPPAPGSYGKGAFCLPSGLWTSTPWKVEELSEAMRKKSHSTPHLELMNMLESVLKFASTKQRVLCYCDCDPAVRIAIARYSETANKYVIQRLREFDAQCCIRDLSVRFCWKSRELPLPKIADAFSRGKVGV